MANTLAVVCCYGLFDTNLRSAKEIEGYRSYLINVVRSVIAHPEITSILVCGGRTDPRRRVSESVTVKPIMINMFATFDNKKEVPEITCEEGVNVAQHIEGASERIINRPFSSCIVYCDRKSHFKAWAIADYLLPFDCQWRIVSFKRKDVHPKNKYILQWLEGLRCRFDRRHIENLLDA